MTYRDDGNLAKNFTYDDSERASTLSFCLRHRSRPTTPRLPRDWLIGALSALSAANSLPPLHFHVTPCFVHQYSSSLSNKLISYLSDKSFYFVVTVLVAALLTPNRPL